MTLTERDTRTIWHPYTQHGLEKESLGVISGSGATLTLENGLELIDAVSSWWVNLHGHAHPAIAAAIAEQAQKLEQVIFAGFTHQPAIDFAERFLPLLPRNQKRIFYSDNGSTAVEAALKMSLQFFRNQNEKRYRFLYLEGGYHGDTFGAMSVSSRGVFTEPFAEHLFPATPLPVPVSDQDERPIQALERELQQGDVAAFIYEPLIQGVGGMRMYSGAILEKMLERCRNAGVLTIADEVMTGFGRTGTPFASQTLSVSPDMMCFSKGITGGFLPLGATTATEEIFQQFWHQDRSKMLFHGHSFTANLLSLAAAGASITLLQSEECEAAISRIFSQHQNFIDSLTDHPKVDSPRVLGTILALDLKVDTESGYLSTIRDTVYRFAIQQGVLLRPLGNVIYLLPPYCISDEQLSRCYQVIRGVLDLVDEKK